MDTEKTFIEVQFPVSKLSKESYKERKANYSQTLTSLGKWWGRKPLVLVRAAILGLLLPATDNPRRDREVFLKLMTMDPEGLWRRKTKAIALKDVHRILTPEERATWFEPGETDRPRLRKGVSRENREALQRLAFERMGYDEQLTYCDRPEQVDGPSPEAWAEVNAHLGTHAASLSELVRALGERRFGHVPRVGDAFCGGGSVPFEAARLGCEAYGSDLNPVAALLTWGALNIIGGGESVAEAVRAAQEAVFAAVDRQVTEWGIEHNAQGWRADAYLYCHETRCPECGWLVPLAPAWVIGEKTRCVAVLDPDRTNRRFHVRIQSGVSETETDRARTSGTVRESRLHCSRCERSTPIAAIRGDRRGTKGEDAGPPSRLRMWENDDLVPQPDDVFQERLYCIRWTLPALDELLREDQALRKAATGSADQAESVGGAIAGLYEFLDDEEQVRLDELRERDWHAEDAALAAARAALDEALARGVKGKALARLEAEARELAVTVSERERLVPQLAAQVPPRVYRAPLTADLEREARALALLKERFADWQTKGYIPSRRIEPGEKTDEPIRTRGWTHWHHLFTPRQLLLHGLAQQAARTSDLRQEARVDLMLGAGMAANWDSKLCQWGTGAARESISQSFYNQALNTLYNFPAKALPHLWGNYGIAHVTEHLAPKADVRVADARAIDVWCDLWLTDPPYADAINYHELSEFFLAWYEKQLPRLFPDWYADSKRALAVVGKDEDFRKSMVACYRNLVRHMPDNGLQLVMFTHQNAAVWADLALILAAAGLRVTAAWTIATETESALKIGQYVQGTVLTVLRRRAEDLAGFTDEIAFQVEQEVERQLASMLALEDDEDPNFSDSDYQLAAYAAALRVVTQYRVINGEDVEQALSRPRRAGERPVIETIIEEAVRTASNYLIPRRLAGDEAQRRDLWRALSPEERFYLKGLEVEGHGEYRTGVYQEPARGFGLREYRPLLHTGKANETRLATASELKRKELGTAGFGSALLRHVLFAVHKTREAESAEAGYRWLHDEAPGGYWTRRTLILALLRYLAGLPIAHWSADAEAARTLAGRIENEHT